MEGKHGTPEKKTEVPRETLVEALKTLSHYFTTQDLQGEDELSQAFTINL
jgi:predicted xylose isomerase-like sugar epimerase